MRVLDSNVVDFKDFLFRAGLLIVATMTLWSNITLLTMYWRLPNTETIYLYYFMVSILTLIACTKVYLFVRFCQQVSLFVFTASLCLLGFEVALTIFGPKSKVPLQDLMYFFFMSTSIWVIAWQWLGYLSNELNPTPAVASTSNVQVQQPPVHVKEAPTTLARLVPLEPDKPSARFFAKLSSIKFDDIWGMDELKERLSKATREIVGSDSMEKSYKSRNGVLLYGEPGNGKTFIAEAIAGELNIPIISASYGDIASKWINDTTENLVRLFADARAQAPCVLFFDEIDSLITDRTSRSSSDETQKLTNVFLTEIVNLRQHKVVFVGATNFLERLDQAAIREGRFDFKIEISPPDKVARGELLYRSVAQHFAINGWEGAFLKKYAARWEGFSVKRIQSVADVLLEFNEEENFEKIDGALLTRAMRRLQGRKGHLPENTKSLQDLILTKELRDQLTTISLRMKNFDYIESRGGTVPSGLLFFGEPGTGKTETARALAKESPFAFLSTSGNDLINQPTEIDRLMKEAKDIRPCIIFIDEADDVLANRTGSFTSSVTNKLLTAMNGASGRTNDIVFIAATNHPERLDTAVTRGGRFTEKVFFPLPDKEMLAQFVSQWIENSNAFFCEGMSNEDIVSFFGEGTSIASAGAIMQEAVNQMIGRPHSDDFYGLVLDEDIVNAVRIVQGHSKYGSAIL